MNEVPKEFSTWSKLQLPVLETDKTTKALVSLLDYLIGAAWTDQEIKDALIPIRETL